MKKVSYRSYFFLFLFLVATFHLPKKQVESLRETSLIFTSFLWKNFASTRAFFTSSYDRSKRLEKENHHLKKQIKRLSKRFIIKDQIDEIQNLEGKSIRQPLTAHVIYRDPNTWSSTLWIDVGKKTNQKLGYKAICKNSPVLLDGSLIGVVEWVGKKKSRVRLITDARLVISVRVARGEIEKKRLFQWLDPLILELRDSKFTSLPVDEKKECLEKLQKLKQKLQGKEEKTSYLAKGELRGTSAPLWRCHLPILKGIGFNYDFADEFGGPYELRSGKPYDSLLEGKEQVLLKKGDLLVTTGMDGVFPPHIPVARIVKVMPLQEGAVSYDIKAKLLTLKINDLKKVIVLPALASNDAS